jgi:type II secretory pathway component GspD/PulD (secretin)
MADLLQKVFRNATIVAEPRSNTLLIRADDKVKKEIQELIQKLDVEPVKPPAPGRP